MTTAVTNGRHSDKSNDIDDSNHIDSDHNNAKNPNHKSKNQKDNKKKRRKKKKRADRSQPAKPTNGTDDNKADEKSDEDVEIEYVAQSDIDLSDPTLSEFASVFAKFQLPTEDTMDAEAAEENVEVDGEKEDETEDKDDENMELGSDDENDQSKSKRKMKKESRLTVAELKQLVKKPEVVEWVDVTAADPKLLVELKSYRNTVPVPQHWQQKRKYLQGKRGIEKPPFELPDFIKDTGIMDIREAVKEKEEASKLKSKTRERLQPKMGKLGLDYQKLHDAFFRWQTKPNLTRHGELYYEGKEFETKLKSVKPGAPLSDELRKALAMPPLAPPPWLINMQRYGPPPSYPGLKIPGLNAPIPPGAQWGYHPGGWGKPPVDEYGRPLYGDVYGLMSTESHIPSEYMQPVEKTLWGELEEEEEEEEEVEEMEEASDDEDSETETAEDAEDRAPSKPKIDEETLAQGLVTPSGLTSVPSGLETPDTIELRKRRRGDESEEPRALYQVLQQKDTSVKGFMGSQHVYDLANVIVGGSGSATDQSKKRKHPAESATVSLDPSELEDGISSTTLKQKYESSIAVSSTTSTTTTATGSNVPGAGEDFSDMVAEYSAKQANKKRKVDKDKDKDKKDKKYKEFKF